MRKTTDPRSTRPVCLVLCALLLFALAILPGAALGEEPVTFVSDAEVDSLGVMKYSLDTPTLKYTIETFVMHGERCFLTRIWVQDPARQIQKATGEWKKSLRFSKDMAQDLPDAMLAVNGSGYVSPRYPEIPENYPGGSEDYFYTPLGSVTVTNGEVFRNLEGVPYYGLALTEDGLQMYTGADNEAVLAEQPIQTWSFYENCPMMRDNEDLLPEEWPFADKRAPRTIIARVDKNNYLILTVTKDLRGGISLRRAITFFQENFETEWVYNLDGGVSSALLVKNEKGKWKPILGGAKDEDIMAFCK